MTTPLHNKRQALQAKQSELAAIFSEAGAEMDLSRVTRISGTVTEKVATIQTLAGELNALGAETEQLAQVEAIAAQVKSQGERLAQPAQPFMHPTAASVVQPSIGELFVGSAAYKGYAGGKSPVARFPDYDVKTLFETGAGWEPQIVRSSRVELTPERRLVISDLPSLAETRQAAVKYMRETSFVNEAAETAEGQPYGEATLATAEQSVLVRKIAVFLPVTDEQLEDEPRARDYVNNRLARMLRERLDGQILNGSGVAPNLQGISGAAGVQTQAVGADTVLDALHKAITKVRFTAHSEPDAVVLHPNDWQGIRLTRTTDGVYIWGNPAQAGAERVWGLPVVITPAIAEGTVLVGAFRHYSELVLRRGVDIQVSNSHDTYFTNGMQAIRADIRVALVVYRPSAYCKVTGV